jgi:hypothetical protein
LHWKTLIGIAAAGVVITTVVLPFRHGGGEAETRTQVDTRVAPQHRSGSDMPKQSNARAGREARRVVFENGLLSLHLHEQRLGPVLVEISRKSAVPVFSAPEVDQRVVSLSLYNVPLEQGLRQLFADCDAFFYFSQGAADRGALRTVWAYAPGGGRDLLPVPPETWASTQDFERKLTSTVPAERIQAIETIVARDGPASLDTVMRLLIDPTPEVRLRALDVALSASVPLSDDVVVTLTSDASPEVRALALEAIVSGTEPGSARVAETEPLLRRMLGDPDEQIRARAREVLDAYRSQ